MSNMQTNRPKSVILGRDPDVLRTLLQFYAMPNARILDCTCNAHRMWKGVKWKGGVIYSDIDPSVDVDVVTDFHALAFASMSFDVIVFDPPHLPAAAASLQSSPQMIKNYGLRHSEKGDNVSALFRPFLLEAARVLRPNGLIFAKLKDFIHNHRYQWTLLDFVNAVRLVNGLTACDLIIKRDPCGGNLASSKWKKAHHVRNVHSWWVVVRKGKCEATL